LAQAIWAQGSAEAPCTVRGWVGLQRSTHMAYPELQADEQAQVAENVEILSAYEDPDLVETLKQVLKDRQPVVQALMDWAVPDRASGLLIGAHRHSGVIKSFNDVTGYGFIDCPEVHAQFGNDVFLSVQQLGGFSRGSEVTFVVLISKDGKPQAFDLAAGGQGKGMAGMAGSKGSYGGAAAPKGCGKAFNGTFNARPPSMPTASAVKGATPYGKGQSSWQPTRPPASAPSSKGGFKGSANSGKGGGKDVDGITDKRFEGVVKSFNAQKGFGFIECEELKEMFGNDVFLHHSQLGSHEVGEPVSFSVFLNKESKPQGMELGPPGSMGESDTNKRPAGGQVLMNPAKRTKVFT